MTESEWNLFRKLQALALDRCCQRVLTEVSHIIADEKMSCHDRYLAVYRLLKKRDDELANAFDGPRRSTALRQLACIQSHKLLTEEEFARFTPQTRETVEAIM
jgi:hypothetical protein